MYTPEDSLVFGGNFLHSFAIEKQLRVAQIEELTKVPTKFRFPFFNELQWYALDKYAWSLLGRTHIEEEEEVMATLFGEKWERQEHLMGLSHQHITPQVILSSHWPILSILASHWSILSILSSHWSILSILASHWSIFS